MDACLLTSLVDACLLTSLVDACSSPHSFMPRSRSASTHLPPESSTSG